MTALPGGERLEELRALSNAHTAATRDFRDDPSEVNAERLNNTLFALDAALVAVCLDSERLDWLEARNVQIDRDYDDHQRREVHEIRGTVNDREWHKVGQGATVREAIDAARRVSEEGGTEP
jgi:hypothetical protein